MSLGTWIFIIILIIVISKMAHKITFKTIGLFMVAIIDLIEGTKPTKRRR